MTLAVFFGCAFIAFGPSFSLFVFTVAKDPLRVIILIAGAFFWLLSLLLSSLVWFIAVKASNSQDLGLQRGLLMFGVFFSVLLQEVFRFVYYRLLRKANEGLAAISDDDGSAISVRQMAYVAGLGFGIMSGAFSMINVLSDSLGPGTVGIFGDSQYYFITAGELLQSLMGHDLFIQLSDDVYISISKKWLVLWSRVTYVLQSWCWACRPSGHHSCSYLTLTLCCCM
uniref:Gamma-secretase subunit APH-1 n=1 Tax=Sinocyclocheilus anshuiensis TaxID=1608454 RepID=A0A671MWD1_9TELE